MKPLINSQLVADIRMLLSGARLQLQQSVNTAMVQTYWQLGRLIVEDEQAGQTRAEYGTQQLAELAAKLQAEFGKGFDAHNLRNMRRFYLTYPIWNAVRTELGWTHYRALIRIDNPDARERQVKQHRPQRPLPAFA